MRESKRNLPPGTCRLTMLSWEGDFPLPGEYLASERGRTAYLVLDIRPRPKAGGFHVVAERHRRDTVPSTATIHSFWWVRRDRRRRG